MVLFYQIIKILDWPQLAASGQSSLALELAHCLGVRGILIDIDDSWYNGVPGTQSFAEETLRRSSITPLAQHKFDRVAVRIYCPLQIHPLTFDLDVRLVHTPGIVG